MIIKIKICGISILTILSLSLTGQTNFFTAGYKSDSIYFTDIIPDTTLFDDYGEGPFGRDLDIDNDGLNDFRLEVYLAPALGWCLSYVSVIPYRENRIVYSHIDSSAINECNSYKRYRRVAQIFNFGDTIGQGLKYTNNYATLAEWESCPEYGLTIFDIDDWIGIGEKYIGGYILKNDTLSFCWILVQVNNKQSITIKEYAVNKSKQNDIKKVQAGVPCFTVYPNPASNLITISKKNNFNDSYVIKIEDNTGRTVLQGKIEEWERSQTINISYLKAGMYYLIFYGNNETISKKLLVF